MTLRPPSALVLGALIACSDPASTTPPSPAPRSAPVSAFTPLRDAGCGADYTSRAGVCVHMDYAPTDVAAAEAAIAAYKAGARAPMLEAAPGRAKESHAERRKRIAALAPDALSAPGARDAEAARQRRLASLTAMIARLEQRSAGPDGGRLRSAGSEGATASGAGGSAGISSQGAGGDPIAEKLDSLRRLVQRLPDEDAQVLRTQLSRDGFTPDEISAVLPIPR